MLFIKGLIKNYKKGINGDSLDFFKGVYNEEVECCQEYTEIQGKDYYPPEDNRCLDSFTENEYRKEYYSLLDEWDYWEE